MKFLFDFGPIILFFIVYKSYGLYAAIYTMIAATFVQLMYTRLTTGRFENSHIITFVLLLVFGGISIALRNPAFVMWKVSILYVIFALALIASNFIGKKTILERMLSKELILPRSTWERLNWIWGFGFVGIAIVNAYFVNVALSARKAFFDSVQIDTKIELSEVDCPETLLENLCSNAQQTEQAWVNFKLFGTLGLTLLLIVITVVILSKHIKEKETKI